MPLNTTLASPPLNTKPFVATNTAETISGSNRVFRSEPGTCFNLSSSGDRHAPQHNASKPTPQHKAFRRNQYRRDDFGLEQGLPIGTRNMLQFKQQWRSSCPSTQR